MSMTKLVQVSEDEGFKAFLGKEIQVWCANYIYAGTLVGVNENDIMLENAGIVYETGPLTTANEPGISPEFKDFQMFTPKHWYIRTAAVESYGEVVRKS